MDIRDICAGTQLYLPVEVARALFSVGDTHARVTARYAEQQLKAR